MNLIIEGHISPQDKASSDYCYVPFDVPENVARIDVRYTYSHPRHHGDFEGKGNTIDIGLFDQHGHDFLQHEGFRGWSGSDRQHIWVGESPADTAPGYLAGPIGAGRWHVALGLYRVATEGCDYRVTIEFTSKEQMPNSKAQSPTANAQNPSPVPRHRSPAWFRGDLQSHTHHSDGKGSLATLIETARGRGLDFLAVTDHNNISHVREFAQHDTGDLLLIPATEVTTYYGHMNVWGVRDWLDFRCRDVETMRQIIAEAHRRGLLASVNHPKQGGPPWEYGSELDFDCIEVWQAPWPVHNLEAFNWWDSLLQQGRRIVAVGGSDYHQPTQAMQGNPHLLGNPTTWVYAEAHTVDAILDGIRRGHVYISADVEGPHLELHATLAGQRGMMGDTLQMCAPAQVTVRARVRGAAGACLRFVADGRLVSEARISDDEWMHEWMHDAQSEGYLRIEVGEAAHWLGADGWLMLACSNPIYLRKVAA